MITRSITPKTPNQRVADYLARRALMGEYTRSARPYPSTRSLSGTSPLPAGQAAEPSDYRPEMGDCPGW